MTGRFAAAISAAADLSWRAWPSMFGRKPGRPAMTSSSVGCCARVSCWRASLVMSMWTGPGRPDRAIWNASGHDTREVIGITDEVVVLRHRQGDSVDVDLLERVLADQDTGHVAGDRHDRHRVQERRPDPGDEVGRARARGAHAHTDPTGHPRVAVGGVRAALLVADEDVAQLGVVAEDVVERQDDAARIREEDLDPLAQERLAQDVRADPGPLQVAPLMEHPLPGALDRGGLGGAVIGDVAAPGAGGRRGPRRVRGLSLCDRHLSGSSVWSFEKTERPSPSRQGS
jgi:hypothetical protein